MYPVETFDEFAVNQVLDPHWGILNDEDVRYLFCFCGVLFILFYLFLTMFNSSLAKKLYRMEVTLTDLTEDWVKPLSIKNKKKQNLKLSLGGISFISSIFGSVSLLINHNMLSLAQFEKFSQVGFDHTLCLCL